MWKHIWITRVPTSSPSSSSLLSFLLLSLLIKFVSSLHFFPLQSCICIKFLSALILQFLHAQVAVGRTFSNPLLLHCDLRNHTLLYGYGFLSRFLFNLSNIKDVAPPINPPAKILIGCP